MAATPDIRDPSTHPMRYYSIMSDLEDICKDFDKKECEAVATVLGTIAAKLSRWHFEEQVELNQKSLVKTFEEC